MNVSYFHPLKKRANSDLVEGDFSGWFASSQLITVWICVAPAVLHYTHNKHYFLTTETEPTQIPTKVTFLVGSRVRSFSPRSRSLLLGPGFV